MQTNETEYRLFISIGLPERVKTEMEQLRAELSQAVPHAKIRWFPRDQRHLTLKFLGKTDAGCVEPMTEALRDACANVRPIRLRAQGAGCFPDIKRPRVLWVGVRDDEAELERLQKAICIAVKPFGAPEPEEKFVGHATLGRIKQISRHDIKSLGALLGREMQRLFGAWTAEAIELMRSELSEEGARYTCLESIPLGIRKIASSGL